MVLVAMSAVLENVENAMGAMMLSPSVLVRMQWSVSRRSVSTPITVLDALGAAKFRLYAVLPVFVKFPEKPQWDSVLTVFGFMTVLALVPRLLLTMTMRMLWVVRARVPEMEPAMQAV